MFFPENTKKRLIFTLAPLFLILLTVYAYEPLRECDFANFDDDIHVYENSCVKEGMTWDCVKWAFSSESVMKGAVGIWHPITWLSLMLDREIFGLDPSKFHLVNLFFHLLNTILVLRIFNKSSKDITASFLVACLFALHPLHVESVAWISERKDLLCTFLGLLSIEIYISFTEEKKISTYILSVLMFALSLLSKPMLVTLPVLLIFLDYWPLKRFQTVHRVDQIFRLLLDKIPFFFLSINFSILAYLGQKKAGAINVVGLSFLERVENAILSYTIYLKKMVWPIDLAVLYPVPINYSLLNSTICLLAILVITVFVLRKGREKQFLIVGWFWYLLTLLPVIGIVHLGHQAYADRYTYFPLIGIFIIISWTVSSLLERFRSFRTVIFVFICFILILLTLATRLQVSFWKNTETLMEHAILVNRDNYMAHYYLGDYLIKKGNLDKGINHLKETIRLKPQFCYPRLELIEIYKQQNKIESAVSQLREMTRIIPQNSDIYNKVGTSFFSLHLKEDAMEYFKKSLDINPSNDMAHENIGLMYFAQGNTSEAIKHLNIAIRILPNNPEYYYNLALVQFKMAQLVEAEKNFSKAIGYDPGMFQAYFHMGLMKAAQKKYDESEIYFLKTLRLKPEFVRARKELEKVNEIKSRMH